MEPIEQAASTQIIESLQKDFGFQYHQYWYPLKDVHFKPVIALLTDRFLQTSIPSKLMDFFSRNSPILFEVNESSVDGQCFWTSKSDEFILEHYSEKIIVPTDFSWIIYYSHENSIAFGGQKLIEKVQTAFPKWKSIEW